MLRSEITRPLRTAKSPLLMMGFGGGLIGAAIAMAVIPKRVIERTITTTVPVVVEALPPASGPSDVQMVFRAGDATYMKLGDAPTLHVRLTVYDRGEIDRWETSAVGEVEPATIPEDQRHWLGKQVLVDGTCTATVTGFAVVARVKGEADYAGVPAWNADAIYEHGTPVLAAKLDRCDGTFARDAALAPVVMPERIEDAALARRAEDKLRTSALARHSDVEWNASNVTTIVMRHPVTKVTWISVHDRFKEECGGSEVNLWGLYRVDGDRLVTVQQRGLDEIFEIDRFVDLEGDGELEMIGTPWWGGDHIVQRASGDEVTRLVFTFFGCPC